MTSENTNLRQELRELQERWRKVSDEDDEENAKLRELLRECEPIVTCYRDPSPEWRMQFSDRIKQALGE